MKMASSSSSSSSKCSEYDVFLSFSGETRKNLTDHLYCTLKDHRFNVFLDEKELTSGETVTPTPKQAVKGSRLAAIIFSRGYAESRWCLDELVEILDCRRTMGLMVLPIFYNIDPTDVRHQTRDFEEAFQRHEERFPEEKVRTWRNALNATAGLAGVDFSMTDGHKGRFVRNIVDEISRKLMHLIVAPYPVGIDSRVQEIGNYLDVGGSNNVRIIGIWGMGGLGKSTVAKAVFNRYQDKFAGTSFLANVREDELVDSQRTLLSDVLRSGTIKVRGVAEGTKDIKTRLGNLRALVIIDGVDSVQQLDALAIKHESFGPGSRIIITTRNEHLLKTVKADKICPVAAMNKEEALELLSWHAFQNNYPNKECLQVSREVVDYCGGLPLALAVLGSYLFRKSSSEWKSALRKMKRSRPLLEIHRNLKRSYDGLFDDDLKDMFLDISSFFTGMNKDYVMKILDGCDLCPEIGFSVLEERCLVTANDDFKLVMHDLLRDMGREIVREKSPCAPGKRSRLWDHEDVIFVLRTKSGTEAVQGLTLDLQESDEASFSTEAFRNMQSLRLLKLNYVKLTGSYNNLPNELRWLCWHGFPLDVLPEDFDHPNIVVIDLSYSKLTRVWEDSNLLLEKLKFLNLSHSHNLTRSPDFSKTPNLERLILKDCKNLQAIPALPTNLEILEADECIALEKMPDFSEMSRMRELHLNHSPKLSEILGLDKALNSMTSIHMEGCTNLTASFKEAILQGWSARGNGGLFLPGNDIPSWFTPVDPQGEITVPQIFGCDLKALTLCIIYSSDDSESGGSLRIRFANYTQNTVFLISPMRATVITSHENYLWLGHLSNNKLNVKGGDKINVGAHFVGPGTTDDIHLRVKKIGINLEKEKLINEYALGCQFMPYSSECKEDGNHKAGHGDDSSHENQSRKRLRLDPSVERNAEEENDEIMQEGSSMGLKWPLPTYPLPPPLSDPLPLLLGLNSTRVLSLAGCNLTDVAILMELGSLISLDLQMNSFCSLPSLSGFSKLHKLRLNYCTRLRAIPDLPTSLEILEADECIALEKMPDFSEMSRMRVLHLNHSPKLTEIPGLHKSLKSMARIHMEACKNLTADFRKKILQGWSSCGYGGIFLNGNYMPEWFRYFGGEEVCFVVPQSVGSNFEGLTLCCVYSSNKQPEDCPFGISIQNKTKHTALLAWITYASVPTSCDSEDHYLWQGQLSNEVLSWQDGDEIKIFVGPVGPGDNSARVKKIAVDLVWDKFMKENMNDWHPGLYDLNPHEARASHDASDGNLPSKILRSDNIVGDDDEAGPSNDSSDENQAPKRLRPDPVHPSQRRAHN